MAIEVSRRTSVRKIRPDPKDKESPFVCLKVIEQIAFIDPTRKYQEITVTLDNSPDSSRHEHVDDISGLQVYRIDTLGTLDTGNSFQEEQSSYQRYQEGIHLTTHKKKIYRLDEKGNKDYGIWIEVERVDQIAFIDPTRKYQEVVWELNWDDKEGKDDWDYLDLGPVITKWDGFDETPQGGIKMNPPWRIDPFQNIIDCSFNQVLIFHNHNKITYGSISSLLNDKRGTTQTLKKSNWGDKPIYVSQLGISDNLSAIYIAMDGLNTGIIKNDYSRYHLTSSKLVDDIAIDESFPADGEYPIMNGYGNTVNIPSAEVKFNNSGKILSVTPKTLETDDSGFKIPSWLISQSGDRYTYCNFIWGLTGSLAIGVLADGGIGYEVTDWTRKFKGSYDGTYNAITDSTPDEAGSPVPGFYKKNGVISIIQGEGTIENNQTLWQMPEPYDVERPASMFGPIETVYGPTISSATISFTVPMGVMNTTLDYIIKNEKCSVSFTDTSNIDSSKYLNDVVGSSSQYYVTGTTSEDATSNLSFSKVSKTVTARYDGSYFGQLDQQTTTRTFTKSILRVSFSPFPYTHPSSYWINQTVISSTDASADTVKADYYTPYGKITAEDYIAFDGWLHIENTKHILQAFRVAIGSGEMENYIYLDMQRKTSLLGIDAKSIQAVMFDITNTAIKKMIDENNKTD